MCHHAVAMLPCVMAVLLTACGGGGGAVRSTPPPVTPGGGIGFTPTVTIDSSLVVNPPTIPTLSGPASLPQYSRHLVLTNAAGALGAGLTGQGVTIGLLDTGVNRQHPALNGRVTASFIHVNPATNDMTVDDKVGHGTVVAELAAGKGVGSWGGGVAQNASIASSRIISDSPPPDDGSGAGNEIHAGEGYGDFFRAVNAELANAGARIINNSWGGLYWNDPLLTQELATAWRDFVVNRGGIIVFANGNSGADPRYAGEPSDNARLPTLAGDAQLEKGWLTVGALDPDNPTQLTSYSQQCGSAMNYCLVAPGNVIFIDPKAKVGDSSYALYQGGGTSFAAPQVSGAAAVVWSAFPYMNNDQVRQLILGAAKDLGAPGVDPVFGWGLLDVTKAAMGPSNFAWGDFSVSFSGNSVWRNPIIGSGGLIKGGSGILTLAEAGLFTGATRVDAGGLDVRKGLASNLTVASGATVWASGAFGGNVNNAGRFLAGASTPASIAGNYLQTASGTLGVWLGSPLQVSGQASVDGTLAVLGVRSGYTTTARETLLSANGGVQGRFSSLKAASNVFLDASLSYNPNTVFLDINRIDVSKAVAALGLGGVSLVSAGRMEAAMQAIDAQLGGLAAPTIGTGFIQAAGAFQQTASATQADLSLRSLSGQLYGASLALTLDGIDAGRQALAQRLSQLADAPARAGGWSQDLAGGGQLARSGFDTVGLQSGGQLIGNDWRLGERALVGVTLDRQTQLGWLDTLGDRSRGVQQQVQLYAMRQDGPWQWQAQLVGGGFQRQVQRTLLLGALRDPVFGRMHGSYWGASTELGWRWSHGALQLTPYLGSDYVRVRNGGFAETGDTGFGLQARQWDSGRWQALAGVRAAQHWRVGDLAVSADAYLEQRRTLMTSGRLFEASFTGLTQWAPMPGMSLAPSRRQFGIGLDVQQGDRGWWRLDLTRRSDGLGQAGNVQLQAGYRF